MKKKAMLCISIALGAILCGCSSPKSSYDLAVENGFQGSVEEWLESLKGEMGKEGPEGESGKDGAEWHSGTGEPEESIGKIGDYYLDFDTGMVYEKGDEGWTLQGSIKYDGIKEYVRITFDPGNGTLKTEEVQKLEKGSSILLPIPEWEGHVFLGWYTGSGTNAGKATDLTPFSRDMTLIARWRKDYSLDLAGSDKAHVGDFVSFSGIYDGTAEATIQMYLEKDGERKLASEAEWCSESKLEISRTNGKTELNGSLIFTKTGRYRIIVTAEEDQVLIQRSIEMELED